MALALGLTGLRPLLPAPAPAMDSLVVYVPGPDAERLRQVLGEAGAGALGDYDQCSYSTPGEGRFRPLAGSDPAIGEHGRLEVVAEERIEVVLPRHRRQQVVRAMLAAHPYEEPAYQVLELADATPGRDRHRTGRHGGADDARRVRPHASESGCRRPCRGSGWPATRSARCARWRWSEEPETSSSTGWPGWTSTST